MKSTYSSIALALALASCAGRAPEPVSIVQAQDRQIDCAGLTAEINGDNQRITELGSERGAKVAQNVVAGVAGLFIPILWFGMDFQGAAATEQTALQSRQQYLSSLVAERCGRG